MHIEEARPQDLAVVKTLLWGGLEEEHGSVRDFSVLWERYLATTPRTILVARQEEQVVGFAWLVAGNDPLTDSVFDYLFYVAVAPSHRNQGIGQALLECCQSRGRPIRLLTHRDQRAIPLYQRLGFTLRALEWEWQA